MSRIFDMVTGARKLEPRQPTVSPEGALLFTDGKDIPSVTKGVVQDIPQFSTGDMSSGNLEAKKEVVIPVDLKGDSFPTFESSAVASKPEAVSVTIDGGEPITAANDGQIDINAPLWQQRLSRATDESALSEPAMSQDKPRETALEAVVTEEPVTPDVPLAVVDKEALAKIGEKIIRSEKTILTLESQRDKSRASQARAHHTNNPALGTKKAVTRAEARTRATSNKLAKEQDRLKQWRQDYLEAGGKAEDVDALAAQVIADRQRVTQTQEQESLQAKFGQQVVHYDEKITRLQAELDQATEPEKQASLQAEITLAEAHSQEARNNFLAAGGLDIEGLIRENSDDVNGEKPVVIELSPEAQAVANAIPGDLALGVGVGMAVEGAGEERAPEGGVETLSQPEGEKTLEERIEEARLAYVEKDIETTSTIKRLARSFTWLGNKGAMAENPDLIALRERYQSLLTQKKEAEIARITLLDEPERTQEMSELSLYFKMAEGVTLGNLYIEKQRETLSSKLGAKLDWIGEKYNSLSTTKKVALGVVLFGSSIALAATPGAGIAIGAVAVRRFCAGLGGAITLDAAAEKFFSGRQEKKTTAEIGNLMEESQALSPEDFGAKMNEFLRLDAENLTQQIDKKRTKTFFRKWSLRIGGAFGGMALTEYLASIRDAKESITLATDAVGATGAEASLVGVDAPVVPPALPDQVGGAVPETPVPGVAETVPEVPKPSLPESYPLTEADSREGLWGALEKSIPTGLDETHKNQAISSLKNLIATKLEDMSPEDRAAIGFRSGDINTIYAGDTLKLDGLVSQAEFQEILDGKVIDAPMIEAPLSTVSEVAEVPQGVPDTPAVAGAEIPGGDSLGSVADTLAVAERPDNLLDQVQEGSLIDTDTSADPVDGTAKLLGEGGVERAVYYKELENTRRSIFATNDLRFRDSVLNAPKVKMMDVVLAAKAPGETLVENQALFGTDQIARMNSFKEMAVNAYGRIGEPGARETVADYTRRMVTLGFESPESKFNLDKLARV